LSVEVKRFKFELFIGGMIYLFCINLHAYEVNTAGCVIRGADKDSVIINYLAKDLNSSRQRFETFFGEKLSGVPVRILIPENKEEYDNMTQHVLPDWSQGVALPGQRRIILRTANYFIPDRFREILLHELAHIYLAQIVHPARVPLWFNEGIAMYMSEKTVSWEDGIAIGSAIVGNHFIDFQDMDSLLSFGEVKARLAYLQSFLAIRYLIAVHGPEIVQIIIRSVATGASFNDVFMNRTGQDIIDFEYDVYQEINKDYRWMSFLQFSNVFWILMVVLVIFVFITVKLRNRKKIKVWDSVEEE